MRTFITLMLCPVALAVFAAALPLADQVRAQEKTKPSVAVLRKRLKDPDDQVREKAARALAAPGLDTDAAVIDLIDLLERDKAPNVRIAAAGALSMICHNNRPVELDKRIVPALIKAMRKDNDTVVRWVACGAFVMIGRPGAEAAPFLLEALMDKEDARMRQIAGHSLYYVAGPKCAHLVPKLIAMHKKGIEDEGTEITILSVMGKIAARENVVVPRLLRVVVSDDPKRTRVRHAAAHALGLMGSKAEKAVPVLLLCLEEDLKLDTDDPRRIGGSIIEALGRIGSREALPLIRSTIDDPSTDAKILRLATEALKRIRKSKRVEPKIDAIYFHSVAR